MYKEAWGEIIYWYDTLIAASIFAFGLVMGVYGAFIPAFLTALFAFAFWHVLAHDFKAKHRYAYWTNYIITACCALLSLILVIFGMWFGLVTLVVSAVIIHALERIRTEY